MVCMRKMGCVRAQQQSMTEVPKIYALRRNHDDIVQAGFIRPSNASDIMGRLVAGPTDCCVGTVRIVSAERGEGGEGVQKAM